MDRCSRWWFYPSRTAIGSSGLRCPGQQHSRIQLAGASSWCTVCRRGTRGQPRQRVVDAAGASYRPDLQTAPRPGTDVTPAWPRAAPTAAGPAISRTAAMNGPSSKAP
jgi:hypothetical protein